MGTDINGRTKEKYVFQNNIFEKTYFLNVRNPKINDGNLRNTEKY